MAAASATSSPDESDRPLTADAAAAIIRGRFPSIDTAGVRLLGSGWEFDAFVTGDGWVFRFPRHAEAGDLFAAEKRVHELVSGALPAGVAVPRVELLGEPTLAFPFRFAGHRYLAGVAADRVGDALRPALARDLGAALGTIHSIPLARARAAGVRELDVEDSGRRAWLERGRRAAHQLRELDSIVGVALSWLNEGSSPPRPSDVPLRLIHQDLAPEHVLADPETGRLAGILDWTDATLGDPARDFVFLVTWGGWDIAEAVLRAYPLEVDARFRQRLRDSARFLSLMWLAHAHERGSDLSPHIRGMRNAFEQGPSRSPRDA